MKLKSAAVWIVFLMAVNFCLCLDSGLAPRWLLALPEPLRTTVVDHYVPQIPIAAFEKIIETNRAARREIEVVTIVDDQILGLYLEVKLKSNPRPLRLLVPKGKGEKIWKRLCDLHLTGGLEFRCS